MPFRLPKRLARGNDATVLGTYLFSSHTVRVVRMSDERIQWSCDCEKFLRQARRETPLWCKHIAKAAARRSLERLTARRIGLSTGADGRLRGSAPVPRPSGRLPPSRIVPDDLVMPR